MQSNNQTIITIILMSIFAVIFLTALILFISSIISRRKVNKIELPTLEEIAPSTSIENNFKEVDNSDTEGGFYFEDDILESSVIPSAKDVEDGDILSGATRSDYKHSKKKKFSLKN